MKRSSGWLKMREGWYRKSYKVHFLSFQSFSAATSRTATAASKAADQKGAKASRQDAQTFGTFSVSPGRPDDIKSQAAGSFSDQAGQAQGPDQLIIICYSDQEEQFQVFPSRQSEEKRSDDKADGTVDAEAAQGPHRHHHAS